MRVGYVQFEPVFGDIAGNLEIMKRLISPVESGVLVLPELATTGYTFTSREELVSLAEPFNGSPSLDSLQNLAAKNECGLVVGFAESAGEKVYNSAAFLGPDGSRYLYRKTHLFGAETLWFDPGDLPLGVFNYQDVTFGIMICFDWFFPEVARTLALRGAQVICHPVNFVLPWGQTGTRIRSLENHVYMVTANRYGREQRGEFDFTFTGKSQIVSPVAEVLVSAGDTENIVGIIDIDPSTASDKHLNQYNDLFTSRRPELYHPLTGI